MLRLDLPEYPPYALDALFFDFSGHARAAMAEAGHDPDRLAAAAARLRRRLTAGLTPDDVASGAREGWRALQRCLAEDEDVSAWLAAKSGIVTRFIRACAATLREASGGRMRLMPQAFPPPWNVFSGFDFSAIAAEDICGIGAKLYTMHWPMMLRSYADSIAGANPAAGAHPDLGQALMRVADVSDDASLFRSVADIRYPEPDEPHPAGDRQQTAKLKAAMAAAGATPITAFAHGYGPVEDVERRIRIAFDAADGRLFVNRYGYLSDAKLDAIGHATGGGA
ncbi:MAG: hypothetical protein ACRCTI_14180 [Beijerinckiaceae bacterium]